MELAHRDPRPDRRELARFGNTLVVDGARSR